jgi:2-iminobutanoate/2-iminopropanoate deaminase
MRSVFDRREFLVQSGAGIVTLAGVQLLSFPLSGRAQDARSASQPWATYARADAELDLLFLAGETALDLYHLHPHVPHEIHVPEDISAQTHMVMRNLKEVLDDQGLTWANVMKMNRYQKDLSESAAIETVLKEYFDDWNWWPAMTAMEIAGLSSEPARLEIDLIAVVPRGTVAPRPA